MNFKHDDPKIEAYISDTALHIVRHCVRNTVLETYHRQGKISNAELKLFIREVVNKVYAYLELIHNPKLSEDWALLFKTSYFAERPNWEEPEFDMQFISAIEAARRRERSK